jgi:hypothetical protein
MRGAPSDSYNTDGRLALAEALQKEQLALREGAWPFYPIEGFKDEQVKVDGTKPFNALLLVSWLRVARRHTEMLKRAGQWRSETQLMMHCETCGVNHDNHEASLANSPWAPMGPKLRVFESQDM